MEKYKRLRILGTGSFSKVFLVLDGETGEHLVVKQIEAALSGTERENALQEAALLRVLRHPHIVSYREAFLTRSGCICLLMEFAEGGDLHQFLQCQRLQGSMLLESQVLKWFYELCQALRYLHGLGIIHRDIKARNIFLRSSGIVQLGDFGISTVADSSNGSVISAVGTPTYASPERVLRRPYGASADIWSLGIVVYELCALRRPFEAEALSALAERILSGVYIPLDDRLFSPELRCAVSRALTQDPAARPTAEDLLQSPLLSRLADHELDQTPDRCGDMETVILQEETDLKHGHFSPSHYEGHPYACSSPEWHAGPSHCPTSGSWVPREPTPRGCGVEDEQGTAELNIEELPDEPLCPINPDSPGNPKSAWTNHHAAENRYHVPQIGHALLCGARRLLGYERKHA